MHNLNLIRGDIVMKNIKVTEMIITCESCGNVKRFRVHSQDDCEQIFNNFRCENNCGRNLYSYITVGSVARPNSQYPPVKLRLAVAK